MPTGPPLSLSGCLSFSLWSSVVIDQTVTIAIVTRKGVNFWSPPSGPGLNPRQGPLLKAGEALAAGLDASGSGARVRAAAAWPGTRSPHASPDFLGRRSAAVPKILRSWASHPSKMAAVFAVQDGFLILVELLWPPLPDQVAGELATLGP